MLAAAVEKISTGDSSNHAAVWLMQGMTVDSSEIFWLRGCGLSLAEEMRRKTALRNHVSILTYNYLLQALSGCTCHRAERLKYSLIRPQSHVTP